MEETRTPHGPDVNAAPPPRLPDTREATPEEHWRGELPNARVNRLATVFVGLVWVVMFVLALYYIAACGSNCPFYHDEFDIQAGVLGEEPLGPWFWAQNNEHRLPLPRLVYLVLLYATNYDYRAPLYASVVIQALAALVLMARARKIRGRSDWLDALFPVVFLHWGQPENLLWGFQICFALSVLLAAVLLGLLLERQNPLTGPRGLLVGGVTFLLALCGANGLAFLPPLSVWFVFAAWQRLRQGGPGSRQAAAGFVLFPLASAAYIAAYFRGLKPPEHIGPAKDLTTMPRTTLEALTTSLGKMGTEAWPFTGVLLVGLALISLGLLGWALRRPGERLRSLGLLAFLGGHVALAAGIGWGRSGLGPGAGFAGRYVTLFAPLVCALYFVFLLYGRALPGPTLAAACLVLPFFAGDLQGKSLDFVAGPVTYAYPVLFLGLFAARPYLKGRGELAAYLLFLLLTATVGFLVYNNYPTLPRTFLLTVAVFGVYFVVALAPVGAPARASWATACGVVFLLAESLYFHMPAGWRDGNWRHGNIESFARELRDGMPAQFLADRYGGFLYGFRGTRQMWVAELEMLHTHHVGIFKDLAPAPTLVELPLAVTRVPTGPQETARRLGAKPDESTPFGTQDPSLTFKLDRPRFVYGVRVRLHYDERPWEGAPLILRWDSGRQMLTPEMLRTYGHVAFASVGHEPDPKTITYWVHETVDGFWLDPYFDQWVAPCPRIDAVTLLLPPGP